MVQYSCYYYAVNEHERGFESSMPFTQIKLPSPDDRDPHPRLLFDGNRGVHAGDTFHALFSDGSHDITIECSGTLTGPVSWYISTPGFG